MNRRNWGESKGWSDERGPRRVSPYANPLSPERRLRDESHTQVAEVPLSRPLKLQIIEKARALSQDNDRWCRNLEFYH
jgi:hypothetical protein